LKFSDCVNYVNQATMRLNLPNILVKNSHEIKSIANYSAVFDSITVNLQKLSKISDHSQYVMYEEVVHAYEARINAKKGFFPYMLWFNPPHRDVDLDFYISEILQAFMDYIACKHVVMSLGISFDDPSLNEKYIKDHKQGILASSVLAKLAKFSHNTQSRDITEKYIDVRFSDVLRKLHSTSVLSNYEDKFSCIKQMILHSNIIKNVSSEKYSESEMVENIGCVLPEFWKGDLKIIVVNY